MHEKTSEVIDPLFEIATVVPSRLTPSPSPEQGHCGTALVEIRQLRLEIGGKYQ